MPYRPLSLTLLQLATAAALVAADPAMAPTPAKPPRAVGPDNHLVDRVIPAYGMQVLRTESGDRRGAELYHRVHAFVGEIEVKVMAGTLRRGSNQTRMSADDQGRPKKETPQSGQRQPLVEEQQLLALWDELTKLDEALRVPGSTYAIPEQAHLDAAFSDLARAAESLRLGLGDDTYTALDGEHRVWLGHYAAALTEARDAKVKELMKGSKKMSQRDAEAAVRGMDLRVDDAQVARVPAAPALGAATADPAVAEPVTPAAPTAPATAPATAGEPTPAAPSEPAAAELPAAEAPADMPAATEAAPAEATPATEPAPADMPAPADAAPVEQAPADAAPVEVPPTEATPADMPAAEEAPAAEAPAEAPAPAAEPGPMDAPAPETAPVEAAPTDAAPAAEPAPAAVEEPTKLPDL